MNYPKISIITPNYNGGKFLEETIKSVLGQNYPNLEYIIIDGGSTDNSIEIIKKYEDQLSYWVSELDNGLYHAVQKGFDKSSGEIMAWLNSDDLYHKKSLFIVSELFNEFSEINWLQGIPTIFDEKGRTVSVSSQNNWSRLDFLVGNYKWIQQESVFWRRSLWELSGSKIDASLKYAGDFELWLRFFRSEKLFVTSSLLGGFRVRSQNQLSLDHLNDYEKEVSKLINLELENNTTIWEKKIVKKIMLFQKSSFNKNKYVNFIFRIIINKIYNKYCNYPQTIIFDRYEQIFKLIRNE